MPEAQEVLVQLPVIVSEQQQQEVKEANSSSSTGQHSTNLRPRSYKKWLVILTYMLFLLAGLSTSTLLGRLYFYQGGQSKWLSTLVQTAGFPILIPFYFIYSSSKLATTSQHNHTKHVPSYLALAVVYGTLGITTAAICYLSSVGFSYLPVSTLSIISATQLAFTAFFSFFLNSQKLTPLIINSIVLLTISSVLLAFQPNSSHLTGVSKGKYIIGFVCTFCASALTGLLMALSQFFFRKVIKNVSFIAVLNMIFFQTMVASCLILIGLFASSEWKGLRLEMEEYRLGEVSYIMTLAWTAICWQLFSIGTVGLIFEVSSLFSNVISNLGLPIVQVLAVVIFHDKMNGIKVVAMVLAIWGVASYIYQDYIDDHKSKAENANANANANANEVPKPFTVREVNEL